MENLVKYKTENIVPLVAGILGYSGLALICQHFKLAQEGVYANLKGVMSTNDITDEVHDLLEKLDDECSLILMDSRDKISSCMNAIVSLHDIKLQELLGRPEFTADVYDVFYSLSSIDPCEEGKEEFIRGQIEIIDIIYYMSSIRGLYSRLCDLLLTGEIDLDTESEYWELDIFMPHEFMFPVESGNNVVHLLSQLTAELDENREKLMEIEGRRK
ncbi:hypothetical protein ACSBL2_11895 [Pedobacter sp. AW31-3R]|uniref:hypothetical protein n=1 Tax=Pedobacter sp. AW31-3R TaxID=3445781 RepID=UPI003F9F935B